MDLIIRAKEPYEKIMKRESHLLFTQETKFSYEFWNLKKGIPTLISEKVNLHISNSPLLTLIHSHKENKYSMHRQYVITFFVRNETTSGWRWKDSRVLSSAWAQVQGCSKPFLPSSIRKKPSGCASLYSKIHSCLYSSFHFLCCISVVKD